MRILSLFFACLLLSGAAFAQYQPIEQYQPPPAAAPRYSAPLSHGVPAPQQSAPTSQGIPIEQIPQSGVSAPQTVPEPDAPDDSEFETPKNMPPAPEPQEMPQQTPQGAAPQTPQGFVKTLPPAAVSPLENANGETDFTSVVLRGLNKVTARAQTIDVPIGSSVRFGTIEIIAHRCWKSAPQERPENAALLEVSEVKQGEPPAQIFLGWMFSSSPALSALEHPFYDVTVIKCQKEEVDGNKPDTAAPAKISKTPKAPGQ